MTTEICGGKSENSAVFSANNSASSVQRVSSESLSAIPRYCCLVKSAIVVIAIRVKGRSLVGTKLKPGKFDCYANALPDEPMFVLLARDRTAPALTKLWAYVRSGQTRAAQRILMDLLNAEDRLRRASDVPVETAMTDEALACAASMMTYKKGRDLDRRSRGEDPLAYDVPV